WNPSRRASLPFVMQTLKSGRAVPRTCVLAAQGYRRNSLPLSKCSYAYGRNMPQKQDKESHESCTSQKAVHPYCSGGKRSTAVCGLTRTVLIRNRSRTGFGSPSLYRFDAEYSSDHVGHPQFPYLFRSHVRSDDIMSILTQH